MPADWLRETTTTLGWKGELICSKNSQICENDNSREGVGIRRDGLLVSFEILAKQK